MTNIPLNKLRDAVLYESRKNRIRDFGLVKTGKKDKTIQFKHEDPDRYVGRQKLYHFLISEGITFINRISEDQNETFWVYTVVYH